MWFVSRILILTAVLLLVQGGFRRANRWITWGVFLGLPLILTPTWFCLSHAGAYPWAGTFAWVKLYTVQFCACWGTALRFTALGRNRWALGAGFLLLLVNILEAVTKDVYDRHMAHFLVAGSGVLLILSAPHPVRAIRIDTAGPFRDLHYNGLTRPWIIGYTLWNWAFIYLSFPVVAAHQVSVLASAFVIGMIEPRRWLQARAYTLGTDLLVLFTFPRFMVPLMESSDWTTPYREDVAAATCLAIVALIAASYFWGRRGRLRAAGPAEPDAASDPPRL